MASKKQEQWSFDEDCETIVKHPNDSSSCSSSDQEDFEVVLPKESSEFEVINEQKITSLDEDELEIHENYFLYGAIQDSDSDIEILSKSPDKKISTPLYSQILQKQAAKENKEYSSFDSWGDVVRTGNDKSIAESDDDDSEIEVLPNKLTGNNDSSLEIIFSNDVSETQREQKGIKTATGAWENIKFFPNEDDHVEDYGIKALFKKVKDYGIKALFAETEDYEIKPSNQQVKNRQIESLCQSTEGYGLNWLYHEAENNVMQSLYEGMEDYGIKSLYEKAEDYGLKWLYCETETNGMQSVYEGVHDYGIKAMYEKVEDDKIKALLEAAEDFGIKSLYEEVQHCRKNPVYEEEEDYGIQFLYQRAGECWRNSHEVPDDFNIKSLFECAEKREVKDYEKVKDCKKESVQYEETDDYGMQSLFERADDSEKKSLRGEEEDYGIKTLFEGFGEEPLRNGFIAVKTSTLILILCACVLAGVGVGSGCASLFVFKESSKGIKTTAAVSRGSMPAELFLFSDTDAQKFDITNIWLSSNLKKNARSLLNSFRILEEQHGVLKSSLDDYKERYQLQKQMTWYWRKQVKQNLHKEVPISICDGMMRVTKSHLDIASVNQKDNGSSSVPSPRNHTEIIESLQDVLIKEREKTKYWKEKYSAVKFRKCSKFGKASSTSSFSFSSCLKMFSKVLPDFNITSNLPNFTKPVEKISDHVQNAWGKFKKSWQKNSDHVKQDAAKRFRKMFSISNIVNSIRIKESPNGGIHANSEKKYCADEAFKQFKERWKEQSFVNYPKPEAKKKNKSDECLKTKHGAFKTTYQCGKDTLIEIMDEGFPVVQSQLKENLKRYDNDLFVPVVDDLYVEVINGKIRYVSDGVIHDEAGYKEIRKSIDDVSSLSSNKCYVCNYVADLFVEEINGKTRTITRKSDQPEETGHVKTSEVIEENDTMERNAEIEKNEEPTDTTVQPKYEENGKLWYMKRFDQLAFHFDLYKWETDGKMKNLIKHIEGNMNEMKMETERGKAQELKVKKKVKSVEDKLKREKRKYKEDLKKLNQVITQKDKKISTWIYEEKLNLNAKLQIMQKKLKNQKLKYKQKIKKAKQLLKSRISEEYKKLREKKNSITGIKEKSAKKVAYYKTKYQILDEQMNGLKQKYKELLILHAKKPRKDDSFEKNEEESSTKWRFPMVYCPDQMNCEQEIKNDAHETPTTPVLNPTIFDIARLYDVNSKMVSPAPPKPLPPRTLLFPKQSLPPLNKKENIKESNIPLRPSPPNKKSHNGLRLDTTANYSDFEELAFPLAWYHYWGKHRETYNQYEEDHMKAIPLNWYITWMQSRDRDRMENSEMPIEEINWYLKMMKEREEQRSAGDDVPMSWYMKWIQGRRSHRDDDADE